jgi:hypothetical protein
MDVAVEATEEDAAATGAEEAAAAKVVNERVSPKEIK